MSVATVSGHISKSIDDALDALTFGLANNILSDDNHESHGGGGGSKAAMAAAAAASNKSYSSSSGSSSSSSSSSSSTASSPPSSTCGGKSFGGRQVEASCSNSSSSSSSSNLFASNKSDLMCLLCKRRLVEPKLLSCLHSFCKQCLLSHSITEAGEITVASVSCPKCKQETLINGNLGIDSLDDDNVLMNMLDMMAIEEKMLECTSCNSSEKAVARCSDCAQFLCPSCVSAHQFMRCFETHRVVRFDEIRQSFHQSCGARLAKSSTKNGDKDFACGIPIHKPLFCKVHPKENLKFFCHTCQTPVCTDCVVNIHQHPMHMCERLSEVESKTIDELEVIVAKAKVKIDMCQSEFQSLDQCLSSLQEQAETSKGLIEETYNSYKAILEAKKEELLKELQEKHSSKELAIMDLHNSLDTAIGQLNDVVKFVERILKNGNSQEILLNKRLVVSQTKNLFANMPQIDDVDINLRFMTDEKRFERAVNDFFGRFYPFKEAAAGAKPPTISSNGKHITQQSTAEQHQRLQAIQQLQKQFELHQMHQQMHQQPQQQHMAHSAQPAVEPEWMQMSTQKPALLHPYSNNQHHNHHNHHHERRKSIQSPLPSSAAPCADEWLMSPGGAKMPNGGGGVLPLDELQQQQQQQQWMLSNMALFGSASSAAKLTHQQQQLMMNTLSTLQPPASQLHGFSNQQQQQRAHSPMIDNYHMAASHGGGSRSQTPSSLVGPTHKAALGSGDSAAPLMNNLDDFLSINSNNSNGGGPTMAHNFNQLTKLIAAPTAAVDLATLNMDMAGGMNHHGCLNELVLSSAGLHSGGSLNNAAFSDANSNSSSQSPPINGGGSGVIGSGLNSLAAGTATNPQSSFVGNGNLNPPIRQNGKMSNMQIRTKFGTLGSGKSQFNSPHGFCLGSDEEIIVADTNNHRIQVFTKDGDLKFSFGSPGREEGQLWYPRKVAVMRETGKFVVCDRGNERSRMQIFNKSGQFVKKIAIRYIDIVAGLAITPNGDIVAVDSVSPTVFRVSEDGEILKWFECSDHMREPSDIAISGNEYYVCDFKGHCVVVFNEDGAFMRRIGGENITNFPNGIDVSDAGDVLVGDSHGNRFHVAVFSREGNMLSEFECPYVKVSRCCGLKITSEGYVVTLAKNNHHVLVLNTLYVS